MEALVGTYGKTVHSWRFDARDGDVPVGIPELVMGFTGDEQITPGFVTERDSLFGVDTGVIREGRRDIMAPEVIDGADSWKKGFVLQYGLVNTTAETDFGDGAGGMERKLEVQSKEKERD